MASAIASAGAPQCGHITARDDTLPPQSGQSTSGAAARSAGRRGNVKSALYYTILTATSLDSGDWTPCGAAEQGQDDFEFNASGATRFYKASVRDEAE